jgi:hypothetical protein
MRQLLMVAVTTAGMCGVANADCGASSSADVLTVHDWSVEVGPDRMGMTVATVNIELENVAEQPVRMIDGTVLFEDALGGYIANITIERDLQIPPGGTASWTAEYGGTGLDRVPNLRRDEITVDACVESVLYEDGTVERFDQ